MSAKHVIETEGLTKVYTMGKTDVHALRGVDLRVEAGEMIAVMGASGSGKSTLMNIMGCLDAPTSGTYHLDGLRVDGLDRNQLADIRNRKIGFVFQGFNLLARTTALAAEGGSGLRRGRLRLDLRVPDAPRLGDSGVRTGGGGTPSRRTTLRGAVRRHGRPR